MAVLAAALAIRTRARDSAAHPAIGTRITRTSTTSLGVAAAVTGTSRTTTTTSGRATTAVATTTARATRRTSTTNTRTTAAAQVVVAARIMAPEGVVTRAAGVDATSVAADRPLGEGPAAKTPREEAAAAEEAAGRNREQVDPTSRSYFVFSPASPIECFRISTWQVESCCDIILLFRAKRKFHLNADSGHLFASAAPWFAALRIFVIFDRRFSSISSRVRPASSRLGVERAADTLANAYYRR